MSQAPVAWADGFVPGKPEARNRNDAQKPTKILCPFPLWYWDVSSDGIGHIVPLESIIADHDMMEFSCSTGLAVGFRQALWGTVSIGDSGSETLWSTVLASYGLLRIGSLSHPTSPLSLLCPFSSTLASR